MKGTDTGTSSRARVAVLSNSHAATLQNAWQEMGQKHPVIGSLVTFARPNGQGGLRGLVPSGRSLRTDDPGLAAWLQRTAQTTTLDIDQYDAFIIHGLGIGPDFACSAARNLLDHHYSENLLETLAADVRLAAIRATGNSLIPRLVAALRSISDAPILVTHQPWFSEAIPEAQKFDAQLVRIQQAVLTGLQEACMHMRCEFVPQPAGTLTPGGFTRAEYAHDDHRHMNAAFGRLVLDEVGRRIARR